MKQLRTQHNEETFLDIVRDAHQKEDYQMYALYQGNTIVSVVGFMPMVTLYYGRFIWVCDLVTDSNIRSNGYGEKLLTYVHDWAIENHYDCVALSSGLQREKAHKFYEEKMGYKRVSYVFKNSLKS
ncbi:GNAT family N-acetyltransferase [Thalassobacillus devorans]|uniref:GNAT family N-acetyltransferase n=1 Tax=Thalassobacillus devorans TaxID=279813 RepID=UPI000A1C8304|nr:GNAT family N-acetyltransferase [Thalassobacillus devorans]